MVLLQSHSTLWRVGIWTLAGLLGGVVAAGCGGDDKRAERPRTNDDRAFRTGDDDEGGFAVSAEVGGLNQDRARAVFKRAGKGFSRCLMEGSERNELLGGDVSFYVGVGLDGSVKHAYLEQTTLGDRETEKCLIGVLRAQDWPKPVGGEVGEARSSLGFDPPGDVRPPLQWSIDEISSGLAKVAADLDRCRRHASSGSYSVTMYVGTDGSPMSVGVAPPGPDTDLAIDCIVGVLRGATFDSPGSWPAKVTFDL